MTVFDKTPVVVLPNPFTAADRVQSVDAFLPRETLGAYIRRTSIEVPRGPVSVWHNGHRVPEALWRQLIPRHGDQVIIRRRAQGGGNSKVISTVAMIALMVAAPWAAGAMGFVAGSFAYSAVTAGIMIGGSLLITALLPPPSASTSPGYQQKYETSPTYAISGGRNRARQWEVMPLVMGRHKIVPDYGATYFTESVGDDQYLNQVFHFGLQAGDVELTDIKIGSTPISNYQSVQVEVSGADGRLSMFPGNVDTITGFALTSGVPVERRTAQDVTHIKVELAAQLFAVRDDGGIDSRTIQARIQWRPVGGDWSDIGLLQDAIYATHYWSFVVTYTVDPQENEGSTGGGGPYRYQQDYGSVVFADHTQGEADTIDGVTGTWEWVPHPRSLGQPWYGTAPDPVIGYSSLPGVRMTGARQEPTRQTFAWNVPRGQYEIRVWKETADIKDTRESNETAVSQILAYQADDADYTGQLRMAVRIKATGQLNGVIDELSAIASARLPVWTGSAWEVRATSNPAWWYLWFARGKTISGRRVYGAGLIDQQIDIDAIKAWAAWCDAKSLTFGLVLDQKRSCADVLQTIARAGRASPTWQTGKLGVVWDAADLPVAAMFGPFNIRAGTFRVDYINDGSVDEIIGNFINTERDWQVDEVRVAVPGATTTNNPLTLDLEGCTNLDQAGREVNLLAASQLWHRRRVSWETDIEGWVAGRGDVVQISHDLTVWGYSGRLFSRDGNTITLDKSVPTGGSGILMIRDPEGHHKVVSVSAAVGETDELTITTDMSDFALPGDPGFEDIVELDWAWFFDPVETPGRRFKITSVSPTADGVKFEAIDDAPEYYASETSPYQYTPPRDGALLGGVVFAITATERIINAQTDAIEVTFRWASSLSGKHDVVVTAGGQSRQSQRTESNSVTVQAATGDVLSVTVTPIRATGQRGTPKQQTYTALGLDAPLPPVLALTNVFRDGLTVLHWDEVQDPRSPDFEVRIGPDWANSKTVGVTREREMIAPANGLYWVATRFAGLGRIDYGTPSSLSISGATLVRNVLVTVDEDSTWSGVTSAGASVSGGDLTLTAAGDLLSEPDILSIADVLTFGGPSTYGTYQTNESNRVDIGYVLPARVDFQVDEYAIDTLENFFAYEDIFAVPDVLMGSNRQHYDVTPQIRYAGDDGVFGDWINYVPGLINARHFDVRLVLETRLPNIVPIVTAFSWSIDVPDLIQKAERVMVPVEGLSVTYPKAFHAEPNVQISIHDAVDGDRYVLTDSDEEGFGISIFNGSTEVSRTINWLSQGY